MDTNSIFNIYYLNFSKVYEISMMIDNVIISNIQREHGKSSEKSTIKKGSIEVNSKKYLADTKAIIGGESNSKDINSYKMVENLDIKTTKSILLRRIIEKSCEIKDFSKCKEGDLIKLNGVRFKMLDEESLRQISILKREAFKGMTIEGMDINNIISSIIQDFAYILYGEVEGIKDKVIIKIPTEAKGEFESKYNIDDLLIGELSLIGIYKSEVKESFINNNTFNYMIEYGNNSSQKNEKIISSNGASNKENISSEVVEESLFKFVDIIAIIQDVKFKMDEPKQDKKRVGFFKKLIKKITCWRS